MTVAAIYETLVKPLPATERFELAQIILREIPREAVLDFQTEWSEDDLHDATAASLLHLAAMSAGNDDEKC